MKVCCVFFEQIRSNLTRNKFVYSIYFIVLSITYVALIYQYAIKQDYIENQKRQKEDNFSIFINVERISEEEVNSLFKNDNFHINNIKIYKDISEELLEPESFRGKNSLVGELNPKYTSDYFGQAITNKNNEQNDFVIIVPSFYLATENKGNKTIQISKYNFQIIGERQDCEFLYEIPYTTLLNNFTIDRVQLIIDNTVTEKVYSDIKTYILDVWHVSEEDIILPEIDEETNARQSIAVYTLIITATIAFLNCCYIYVYILQQRKKEFSIIRMLGCSKVKAFFYYMFEMILLATICFGMGIVLFFLLNNVFFDNLFSNAKVVIKIQDLFTLYAVTLIVLTPIISAILICFTKSTLRTQFLEGDDY